MKKSDLCSVVIKNYIVVFIVLAFPVAIRAQTTATLPLTMADTTNIQLVDSIEEKLVDLALKGPSLGSAQSQSKINEYQLRATKNTWINLFTINANYNNQTIAQANQTGTFLFPGASFGVTIPVGTIFSSGIKVKAARELVAISKFTQEQIKRNLRAEIVGKYRQYLSYEQIISIQNQTVVDEETAYLQAKEQFRNGLIKIDEYSTAQKLYNIELSKKITLQLEKDLLKLEIERIIGTSLESVLNSSNRTGKL